jgi:3-methylcrotonyl-CoA carboxylase alpha subunit
MPSVVMAALVKVGDLVEKGQEVVVLSAMKMETTLRAPFRGRVIKINAHVGDKVMPGEILVDLARETGEGESGED